MRMAMSRPLWTFLGIAGGIGLALAISYQVGGLPLFRVTGTSDSDRISVDPAEVDFQNHDGELRGTIEIRLRNEGTQTANILEITATCGCTLPQFPAISELKPGQEIPLSVQVQPPGYGLRESILTIRSTSQESPTIRIPLRLHGQKLHPPYMTSHPMDIRVESVIGEQPPASTFQVTCVEAPGDAWLTGFQASADFISASMPKLVKEQTLDEQTVVRDYEVVLEFSVEYAAQVDQTCLLSPLTRVESTKPLPRFTAIWQRINPIRAAPSSILLTFSDKDAETKLSRRVVLVAADALDWEITSIDTEESWLSA